MTKVLLMRNAARLTSEKWAKVARELNVELVQCTAKSHSEFLAYFEENDISVLVNTVEGTYDINQLTQSLLEKVPNCLKAVCHVGAGYERAGDLDIYKKRGIQLSNTPDAVIEGTADTALYLILGALRNFGALSARLHEKRWFGTIPLAMEPSQRTLGILGLGGIAQRVRDKCVAALDFGAVQYHNRTRLPAQLEKESVYVSFDELIETSDVLFISCPLNESTFHIIGKEALARCKKGVIIINTARGAVIDEDALGDALHSGHVAGVGLDVFENEPYVNEKLLSATNTILLPHVGTHTIESRGRMESQARDNVEAFLRTGFVKNLVPELR